MAVALDRAVLRGEVFEDASSRGRRLGVVAGTKRERVLLCATRPADHPPGGTPMAGFWTYAQEDPDYVAIVDPDGTEYTAGEVLARANQVVHALRSLGLQKGDTVAAILPNGRHPMHVYLAALQAGWYYVPINYRLSPPEVAYILQDSDAKAFISHERFADARERGRRRGRHPGRCTARPRVDQRVPVVRRGRRPAADIDAGRTAPTGAAMHYTSGTTGKPKGVEARRSPTSIPTRAPSCSRSCSACSASRTATTTCTSARRRTTTPRSRRSPATRCTRSTRSCSWTGGTPKRRCA